VPTYDYECGACGNTWEEFQQITENPKRRCPKCRRLKAKRLIGAGAAVLFKGSGFYQTDYRSAEYKEKAKAEKESSSSKDKSSGDKKEPKSSSTKSTESSS
jgi:putative FmdB family regulatory protein